MGSGLTAGVSHLCVTLGEFISFAGLPVPSFRLWGDSVQWSCRCVGASGALTGCFTHRSAFMRM